MNFNADTNQEESSIPWLLGDVRRFKQVLINLIKNSLKFTPSGSITVKAAYHIGSDRNQPNMLVVHV